MWKYWLIPALIFGLFAVPDTSLWFLPAQLEGTANSSGWYPLVHLTDNAFLNWGQAPLNALLEWLAFGTSAADRARISLACFLVGMILLLSQIDASRPILNQGLALLVTAVLAGVFGFDQVIIESLAWFPWTAAAVYRCSKSRPSPFSLAALVVTSLLLAFSSSELASITLLGALLLGLNHESATHSPANRVWLIGSIGAAAVALALFRIPVLRFPDYPPLAHVVPYDGIAGLIRPLIGPATPIAVISREAVRHTYGGAALALVCLSALVILLSRFNPGPSPARKLSWVALGLSLSVLADTSLPPTLSLIAPLAALSRMLPYLYFFPLAPVFLCGCLITLTLALAGSSSRRVLTPGLLSLTAIALLGLCWRNAPLFNPKARQPAAKELGSYQMHKDQLVSPSYHLINESGLWVLEKRDRISRAAFKPLSAEEVALSASHGNSPQVLEKLARGEKHNRWSPGRGFQDGSEWIQVFFKTPAEMSGVELATGPYLADFPRGLRVSYLSSCAGPQTADKFSSYSVLSDQPSWPGEIKFTDAGFPYYGAQAVVKIHFPQSVTAQCLLIQQTAKEPNFDWSVVEIKINSGTN